MNATKAFTLVCLLKNRVNFDLPIKPQLKKIFIPLFWNHEIVLRDSWQGRVASFLEYPYESSSSEQKIHAFFLKAIVSLTKEKNRLENVLEPWIQIKLFKEFGEPDLSLSMDQAFKNSPELDKLTEKQNTILKSQETEHRQKKISLSLLHQPPEIKLPPCDLKTFSSIFHLEENEEMALNYLKCFLENHPSYSTENWKDKFNLIQGALEKEKEYAKAFHEASLKEEKLNELSQEISKDVLNLKAEKKQKLLLPLRYGAKETGIIPLLQACKRLPEFILEAFPERFRSLLLSDRIVDVQKFGEQIIHQFFTELKDVPLQTRFKKDQIKNLFEDPSREVPETISHILPKIFECYLDDFLQRGALGNLQTLLPNSALQKLIEGINCYGDQFLNGDQEFFKQLENQLLQKVTPFFYSQKMQERVTKLLQEASQLLSPQVLEILGLDQQLVSGPLWIEFEKEKENQYQVIIYALGNALNYHMTGSQAGQRYTALKLTRISPEKLTPSFFYSLLKRHLDPTSASKASDIYLGPLECLEAKISPNQRTDLQATLDDKPTSWQLCLNLLLKQRSDSVDPEFDLRWKTFLGFCQKNVKDGIFQLKDPSICFAIEKAVGMLEMEMGKKGVHSERIEITLNEIKEGITAFKNSQNVSLDILQKEQIQLFFSSLGMSQAELLEYRDVIIWALGEDVAEALDLFLSKPLSILPQKINKEAYTLPASEEGIFQKFFLGVYLKLAYEVFQIVTTVVNLYFKGLREFLKISLLVPLLMMVLPEPILECFYRLTFALKRKISELCVIWTIQLFTTKESREQLKHNFQSWKETWKEKILTDQKISYHLPLELRPKAEDFDQDKISDLIQNSSSSSISDHTTRWQYCLSEEVKGREEIIPEEKILEELQSCRPIYLIYQIRRLEMPSRHHSTYWDKIKDPEVYLKALFHTFSKSSRYFNKEKHPLAAYKLLAIMLCLARRCTNAGMEHCSVNAYPLLHWYHKSDGLIDDPKDLKDFDEIVDFLLPGVDLKALPNENEISTKAESSFFYYTFSNGMDPIENLEFSPASVLTKAEIDYYDKLIQAPDFSSKLKELGIEQQLNQNQARVLLFHESFMYCRKKPLVPLPFCLLRFQNLYCSSLAENHYVSLIKEQNPFVYRIAEGYFDDESLTLGLKNRKWPLFDNTVYRMFPNTQTRNYMDFFGKSFCPSEGESDNSRELQSDLSGCSPEIENLLFDCSPSIKQEFKMLRGPASEQIPLLFGIHQRYRCEIPCSSWLKIIEKVLFKPNRLREHLERSKHIAEAAMELLENVVDDALAELDPLTALKAIFMALKVKRYCETVLKVPVALFDLQQKLKKCQGQHQDVQDLLLLVVMKKKPHELSLLDQERYISEIFELLLLPKGPFELVWGEAFADLFLDWNSTIHTLMNSQSSRDRILNSVMATFNPGYVFSNQTQWQRDETFLFQREEIVLNFKSYLSSYSRSRKQTLSETLVKEIKVSSKAIENCFKAMERFCPLSQIQAFIRKGENYLSRFILNEKLHFNIIQGKGNDREAVCEEHPGFYLSKDQKHVALAGLASYLILENHNGKKIVLVPENQWAESLFYRVTSLTGPFSSLLMESLAKFDHPLKSNRCYMYELEGMSIQSSDPEALIYLMCLYYFQGNREALEKTFERFEWLCHIKPIQSSAWNQLIPLFFIQIDNEGISHFRRRLMAALAQNQLLIESNEKSSNFLVALAILFELNIYQRNRNPRETLTLHQEYFLYKYAFEQLGKCLCSQVDSRFTQWVKTVDVDCLIELTGLSPLLIKRYKKIKKALNVKSRWTSSTAHLAFDIAKTSSSFDPYLHRSQMGAYANEGERENHFVKAVRLFTSSYEQLRLHFKNLDFKKLFTQMNHSSINELPSLEATDMTSEKLIFYFPAYYRIAIGGGENGQKLQRSLKMLRGLGDKPAQILMAYLEKAIIYPGCFPAPQEIFFPKKKEEETQQKSVDLETIYVRWVNVIKTLNTLTFETEILKEGIDPLYQEGVVSCNVSRAVGLAVGSFLPSVNAFGVNRFITDSIAKTVAIGLSQKAVKWVQNKQLIPSPGTVISTGMQAAQNKTKTIWFLTRFLIPYGVMLGGFYALKGLQNYSGGGAQAVEKMTFINQIVYKGLTFVAAAFIRTALAKVRDQNLKLSEVIGYNNALAISTVQKACHVFKDRSLKWAKHAYKKHGPVFKPIPQESKNRILADYSILESLDSAINQFLDEQFNLAFVEEDPKPVDQPCIELPDKAEDPLLSQSYYNVHQSLEKYRAEPPSTIFKLKNAKALPTLYINMQQFKWQLEQQITKEKDELLKLFNHPKRTTHEQLPPLSITAIYTLVENETLGEIGKEVGLCDENLPEVELALARLDLKITRFYQVERLLKLVESLERKWQLRDVEILEQLAIEFRNTTTFSYRKTSPRLLRKLLRFQAETKTLLWKKQVENWTNVLQNDWKNVVVNEVPGSGKTFFGIPLAAAYKSDGTKLAAPIFPKSLAGDQMPMVHHQLRQVFGKSSHVLQVDRSVKLDRCRLESLFVLIQGSIAEGEPIQMTKEDAQALQSIFWDRLHGYCHDKNHDSSEEKECLILLKKILHLIRKRGEDIPDEAHEIYSFRKQLNYPLESPKTIPMHLYRIAEACMRGITRDPDLLSLIKGNRLHTLDRKKYQHEIKVRLAEQMSYYWKFDIQENSQRQEFIEFVCDQAQKVPEWIESDAELYSQIALVKGILNQLLPMNFKKRANVEFAASKKEHGEFARPSDGNSHVVETDFIRLPYEALLKTFLLIQSSGLKPQQVKRLYEKLRSNAIHQIEKNKISYQQTKMCRRFGEIIPSLEESPSEGVLNRLAQDPEAILLYIRHFIRKEILYWEYNIQNTSHDFAGIFEQHLSCTGTPYNEGTYPSELKVLRDPTALGEALQTLFSKCGGIHCLNKSEPRDILEEILQTHFEKGSKFSAIIDGGALFTGLENQDVAYKMAQFCEQHRPDIKGIKYYQEGEEIVCLHIRQQTRELKPEECLTYYDQRHGFGSNIPQKGDGLCTLGPHHSLYQLIQQAFRIRALKKQKRLTEIEKTPLKLPCQNIHLALTKELADTIQRSGPVPNFSEIIDDVLRNEVTLYQENYPAMRQKYKAAEKQIVYDKIIDWDEEDFEGWLSIYREFEAMFVTKQEEDPAKLFGGIKSKQDPVLLLQRVADQAISKIEESHAFSSHEKAVFSRTIRQIPLSPLPKKVKVYGNGDGDSLLDLGLEQTNQLTMNQDVQQEQNQEQETELQAQVSQHFHAPNLNPYKEWDWCQISNPASLEWLQCSSPAKKWSWSSVCPLYTVQSLLKCSVNPLYKSIAGMFDERLWMSNNFLRRFVDSPLSQPVEIGSKMQFDLYEVLVHFKEENGEIKIISAGPLSVREASEWRQRLQKKNWKGEKVKAVLWNPYSQAVTAGYSLPRTTLKSHEDLQLLMCQLKFLNGDANYPGVYDVMVRWLKSKDPKQLIEVYEHLHRERGKVPYHQKDIDNIFTDARNLPYEELL